MRLILVVLLGLFCVELGACKNIAVVVDVSIHQTLSEAQLNAYRHKLKHAFDYYISAPASRADKVILYQFTNTPDAPLTHRLCNYVSVKDKPTAHQAIHNLEFVRTGCADWCMGLEFVLNDVEIAQPDIVYLISDESPCPACTTQRVNALHKQHRAVQIFPVGVGKNVGDTWLQRVAAPCLHCIKNKDYLHVNSL